MPSLITLRRKIRSIGNTKQITKAMQMVAASKMRRAQEAVIATRTYAETGQQILSRLQSVNESSHPFLTPRTGNRTALVVIASDRGLAGGYNANVMKQALQFINEQGKDNQIDVITIGRKAKEGLARFGVTLTASFTDFPARPTSSDLRPVTKLTIEPFLANQYDRVVVIYTEFHSMLRQTVEVEQLLPIAAKPGQEVAQNTTTSFEPTADQVLATIVPRMVQIRFLQTVLEAIASEHSSRMLAMKNATDNANELMGDLKLTYNSLRQANITRELAEISAGTGLAEE